MYIIKIEKYLKMRKWYFFKCTFVEFALKFILINISKGILS